MDKAEGRPAPAGESEQGAHEAFRALSVAANEMIIGQQRLMERLLIALLSNGHLLVEGAPGLAKTTAIKVIADRIEGDFHRIQFTPDLLPADLTGTEIFRPQEGSFEFQQGPIFHNLILADEVNRAPAKVQSALLEAMGEHQVTVGRITYDEGSLATIVAYFDGRIERLLADYTGVEVQAGAPGFAPSEPESTSDERDWRSESAPCVPPAPTAQGLRPTRTSGAAPSPARSSALCATPQTRRKSAAG